MVQIEPDAGPEVLRRAGSPLVCTDPALRLRLRTGVGSPFIIAELCGALFARPPLPQPFGILHNERFVISRSAALGVWVLFPAGVALFGG
jgi:hypothetical protein